MIAVENVWKEYGEQVVLERVSLAIADRAFVALVGPSGCGKTPFSSSSSAKRPPARAASCSTASRWSPNRARIAAWCSSDIRYSRT